MAQLYYFTVFGLIVIIGGASATLIIIYSLNIIPMGNDPATLSRSTPKTKIAQYQFLSQLSPAKRLMRHQHTHQLSVVIEHNFACEELLNEYIKQAKKTHSIAHQFYVNSHDHEILSLTNLCSKQYKIIEYFEHHPHTLREEISNRSKTGRQFSEKEVMSILCSCVLAMSYLSKLEIVHYTLNPSDIVLDQEGICKIVCSSLSENLFDFNYKNDFYYAPQTLKIFKMQSVTNGLANKSAVFTLGMTLLHMIFLTPVSDLYNQTNFTLDLQQLNELLVRVQSKDMRQILKKMLKFHSYDRITFTQLQEMLFDVISRKEQSGQTSRACFDNINHSQKLQQSIVRISNEDTSTHNYQEDSNTIQQIEHNCALQLERDMEDQPNANQLASYSECIVLDECDKQDIYSARQSKLTLFSQHHTHKSSQYSPINPKIPTDYSNYNICHTQTQVLSKKHLHQDHHSRQPLYQKENLRPNYTYTHLKLDKLDDDSHPRYVSEDLPEGRYEGYKLGKYRHGFGTFYYKEGGKYCGEWIKNRMEGKGVLYYASNKIAYEGEWKEDMLHGYGVLYNENIEVLNDDFDYSHLQMLGDEWIKYQGYFVEDMKHGQGTLFLSNGQSFRGVFENDQANGPGQYRNMRGECSRGLWLMGALNATS